MLAYKLICDEHQMLKLKRWHRRQTAVHPRNATDMSPYVGWREYLLASSVKLQVEDHHNRCGHVNGHRSQRWKDLEGKSRTQHGLRPWFYTGTVAVVFNAWREKHVYRCVVKKSLVCQAKPLTEGYLIRNVDLEKPRKITCSNPPLGSRFLEGPTKQRKIKHK